MVLEASRGIVQSLPETAHPGKARRFGFVGPHRRETTTMVRRSHRVAPGPRAQGQLALGAGSPRTGRSGALGSWSCGLGALGGVGAWGVLTEQLPRGAERLGLSRNLVHPGGDQRAPSPTPPDLGTGVHVSGPENLGQWLPYLEWKLVIRSLGSRGPPASGIRDTGVYHGGQRVLAAVPAHVKSHRARTWANLRRSGGN